MKISIFKFQALKLDLEAIDAENNPEDERTFNLGFDVHFDKKRDDVFAVFFDVEVYHPDELKLSVEYVAWFSTEDPINKKFKKSNFPKINAPAIAFPYLRSFVSNVSLNAGFKPIMLPSVNFIKLAKQIEAEKEKS